MGTDLIDALRLKVIALVLAQVPTEDIPCEVVSSKPLDEEGEFVRKELRGNFLGVPAKAVASPLPISSLRSEDFRSTANANEQP